MMRLNMSLLSAADVPGCEREHGASQRVGRDASFPGTYPKAYRVAEHGKDLTSMISAFRD